MEVGAAWTWSVVVLYVIHWISLFDGSASLNGWALKIGLYYTLIWLPTVIVFTVYDYYTVLLIKHNDRDRCNVSLE